MRLEKPITWDPFSKGFYERFFLVSAQKEMKEKNYQIAAE